MTQVIQLRTATVPRPVNRAPRRHDDSADNAGYIGWLIIVIFFGLLGSWAFVAPLNGAVVAPAEVKISGNRKSLQHLEGGIVKELRVREGDKVAAGDTLLVLDDHQARSEHEVLAQLETVLRLTELRLMLEQDGGTQLSLPPQLALRARDPSVAAAVRGQIAQVEARRRETEGQAEIIKQRIVQLESHIGGAEAQRRALRNQLKSMQQELASLQPLLLQGIVTRVRLLQLERSIAVLDGQIGEADSNIARAQQAIAEQRQIDAQNRNQRATAVGQELRDVQMRLAEVVPKLANAEAVHQRTVVRAPYAGRVVGLNVFAVGAVIGRGERLLDIVPDDGSLIIEARIAVEDVTDVANEAPAEVHLAGYKQQLTPALRGQVVSISADRLTDGRSGAPYYVANIQIDEADLQALPDTKLKPGMAATAIIPTTSRTAMQYLLSPLWSSFNQAFRQR
jgi:HlyD family type I secretion membrane fusion protein